MTSLTLPVILSATKNLRMLVQSSRFSRSYGDSSVEAAFRMTEGNCLVFYVIVLFCRRLGDYQELRMTELNLAI